jgi:hypothetical protein
MRFFMRVAVVPAFTACKWKREGAGNGIVGKSGGMVRIEAKRRGAEVAEKNAEFWGLCNDEEGEIRRSDTPVASNNNEDPHCPNLKTWLPRGTANAIIEYLK